MEPVIQIAGISDLEEAQLLMKLGVQHLGFPLGRGVRRADLTEQAAVEVIKKIEPPASGLLITYLHKAIEVVNFCQQLGLQKVQLHGEVHPKEVRLMKELDPELYIIKSLIVSKNNLYELKGQVDDFDPLVDCFITDTFDSKTGQRGATGKVHDWDISQALVQHAKKPVLLAGGLNPKNVSAAIKYVRPAGVDVHSGVESRSGRKNEQLVGDFVKAAREAFEQIR